jgi:hypothetical protein
MRLFSKEEISKTKKDQTRELVVKNERLATSLKKILALQKDIDFDADKAKKVKDYQVWCADLQTKMSRQLADLKAYEKLTEDKKEEYYHVIAKKDQVEDKILDLKEELAQLELQVNLKRALIKT